MSAGHQRLPADPIGLCRTCGNARRVQTRAREYWMCRLATTDPRFERYPRLPVLACAGYAGGTPERPPGDG